MKTYLITVYDDFYEKELLGEFLAKTVKKAKKQAKEFYANELDCQPCDIEIRNIREIEVVKGCIE